MFWIEWIGTILTIIGIILTNLDYYPFNIYFGLIGTILWFRVAVEWNKPSLMVIEFIIMIIYFYGFLRIFG